MSTETTTPAKKYTGPEISYDIDESNGAIHRTDKEGKVHVGYYVDGTLSMTAEGKRFRSVLIRWLNEQEKPVKSIVMDGERPDVVKEEEPPCPKPTMRDGDKTPAVVAWYKKWRPAEYRAKYDIKGPGTVTKFRVEEDEKIPGKKNKVAYQEDCILAGRKIPGTEKVEAGNSATEGYADADES